jgi:hypothetical protein
MVRCWVVGATRRRINIPHPYRVLAYPTLLGFMDDVGEIVEATPSDVSFLRFVQELYGGCNQIWLGADVQF